MAEEEWDLYGADQVLVRLYDASTSPMSVTSTATRC